MVTAIESTYEQTGRQVLPENGSQVSIEQDWSKVPNFFLNTNIACHYYKHCLPLLQTLPAITTENGSLEIQTAIFGIINKGVKALHHNFTEGGFAASRLLCCVS